MRNRSWVGKQDCLGGRTWLPGRGLLWVSVPQGTHQAGTTGSAGQSQERLSHVVAQVQVHPAAV